MLENENLILVKGSVPGANGSLVVVRQTSKVPAVKAGKGGK